MVECDCSVEYRDMPGFPGYRVGEDGTVLSEWRRGFEGSGVVTARCGVWKKLQCTRLDGNGGYPTVSLKVGVMKYVKMTVHRLVLLAFRGQPPEGYVGCHNDGDPGNSNLSNLRWDTREANEADKTIHGTRPLGERHPLAKLTKEQVVAIAEDLKLGRQSKDIAENIGCGMDTVSLIRYGTIWSHVTGASREKPLGGFTRRKRRTLTSEDVQRIREKLTQGVRGYLVAKEFGTTQKTICAIKNGRTFKNHGCTTGAGR